MTALHHAVPVLELRSQPQGVVRGYATVWGAIDAVGETVVRGAFGKTLEQHRREGTTPAMLWGHEMRSPVGRWTRLEEDSRGLAVEGQLNMKTAGGVQAYEHVVAQDVSGLSIGFRIPEGGAEYREGIRLLREVELHKVSLVACPALNVARVTDVKSIKPATVRSLEQALEDMGFSRREVRAVAAKGWTGLTAVPQQDDSHELIAAIKAAANILYVE